MGLVVARRAPERVERFVFLEPFAYVPEYLRIFLKPIVGRLFYYSAFGNPVGRWITNAALRDHRHEDTDMMASFAQASLEVPLRYLHLFDGLDSAADFADLAMRKDLIFGARTFEAVRDAVEQWHTVWPEANLWPIEEAGHLLLDEVPDEVARLAFALE